MHNIVLASLSPRRKELLSQLKLDFIVDSLNIEEVLMINCHLKKD